MVQLTPNQVQLLAAAPVGHLATVDSHGMPHVIPVCYVLDGQFLYSALDQKPKRAPVTRLRRVRNIQANPNVALVVDHYEADWSRLWYILVTGQAELLRDDAERSRAIGLLRQKYPQYQDMDIDQNPVIKIIPSKIIPWDSGAAR